jgi:hypothetical protein
MLESNVFKAVWILFRVGCGWIRIDKANSVQFKFKLQAGTELGNIKLILLIYTKKQPP